MIGTTKQAFGRRRRGRAVGATVALALGLGLLSGCDTEEAMLAFRDAAATNLKSGVSALFNGLIDGAFAVFELNSDSPSTTTDTSTETTGGA